MNLNDLIDELIELSNTKYGYLKVGRDTLNLDILFIEKYEALKKLIGSSSFEDFDFKDYPKMKDLKLIVEMISEFEKSKQNNNIRMIKASKAYKK